ncbi:thrombospondin type-1 domain-containing protein 7A-like [Lineus longissimus]|uniref:thrombospondin type-1 domain-containing protein 7A-like n=1 Tax=Lineus longissimus TaxID=88925 RepID=UPI00315CCEDA
MDYLVPFSIISILFLCQELWVAADNAIVVKEEESMYQWITGVWGGCKSNFCGDGGVRLRSVGCFQMSGYETLDFHCRNIPKPKTKKPCFKICDEHKNMVAWKITNWGECSQRWEDVPCLGTTTEGVIRRTVQCHILDSMDQLENEVCEYFEAMPETEKECEFICPQNCVVSEFGPWSTCVSCLMENRTRTRQVLSPPQHNGAACPDLSEMQPCPAQECDNGEKKYLYKVGPWRRCRQYKGKRHKHFIHPLGYQMRDVECIDSDGVIADKVQIVLDVATVMDFPSECIKDEKPPPEERRACAIPQDCVVSNWTPWRPMNHSCLMNTGEVLPGYHWRTRIVMVLSVGEGAPCPVLEETALNTEEEAKVLCKSYKWLTAAWSDCESPSLDADMKADGCNSGLMDRRAICVRENDGVPVNSVHCNTAPPTQVKSCELACSQTCVVSSWSKWSTCEPHKCVNERLVAIHRVRNDGSNTPDLSYDLMAELHPNREEVDMKGDRIRYRKIESLPKNETVQCPHLEESQSCFLPACYSWVLGNFGHCQPQDEKKNCGIGFRHRSVHCYGHEEKEKVKDGMCLREVPKPAIKDECFVPCENDCVLSEWSPWTHCSKTCGSRRHPGQRRRYRTILAYPKEDCSKTCGSRRHPGQRRRYRTILAYPKEGGQECPGKSRLVETLPCSAEFCSQYHWGTSPWEKCITINKTECGPGSQMRQVICYKGNKAVPEKRCYPDIRPDATRNCTAPCPINCKMTKFSEWTSCPVTCMADKKEKPYQIRQRYILQHAQYGGTNCPYGNRQTRVCPGLEPCYRYGWEPTKWSGCVLPHRDQECGNGVRTRALYCVRTNISVNESVTVTIDECIKHGYEPPSVVQDCVLSCDKLCDLSGWSDWSRCTKSCLGHKRRSRFMIGSSISKEECRDKEKYPMVEKIQCKCPKYTVKHVGDWSDCILEVEGKGHPIIGHGIKGECGGGRRYKALMCKDDKGFKGRALECSDKAFKEEVCVFNCHKDCLMSKWTPWTACTATCGCGVQTRTRKLMEKAHVGGRKCPKLDNSKQETETRPCCGDSCDNYKWITEPWSQCSLGMPMAGMEDFNCGPGTQERSVRCVYESSRTTQKEINASMCDHHAKPQQTAFCHVPCPGDCIVSQWSEWSLCPQPCDILQSGTRHRSILQKAKANGPPCPQLNEIQPCILNQTCHEYSWQFTTWSSCLLPGAATCGNGKKIRHRQCVRHDRRIVASEHCEGLNESKVAGPLEISCSTTCDVDCVVSHWSEWTKCDRDCGIAYKRRWRSILLKPEGRGRDCPPLLDQKMPCEVKMCYKWDVSQWTECQVLESGCGGGMRYRNITCRQDDEKKVSRDLCVKNLGRLEDLQTETSCRVPCPGDCVMSRWSRWGECVRKGDGPDEEGIQTRSRAILSFPAHSGAPCPTDLWETRPCKEGEYYTFKWHVSDWKNNTRDTWCQRSDGIRAIGGCPESLKPLTIKSCNPECLVPNTYCHDINECRCLEGFDAILDSQGALRDCNMTVNASQKTQDGTEMLAIYYPHPPTSSKYPAKKDDVTNFWMYAVIGAGSAFIIFVAIALYTMCRRFEKERRQQQLSCVEQQSDSNPSSGLANNSQHTHSKKVGLTSVHPLNPMTPSRIEKREEPKYRRDRSHQPFSQS